MRKIAAFGDTAKSDMLKYGTDMRTMLTMETQRDAEERISWLQNMPIHYITDGNLKGLVEEDGVWTPKHGSIVVNTLIA